MTCPHCKAMKAAIKAAKLNEGTISMLLGVAVVIVVGLLVINYFKDLKNTVSPSITQNAAQTQKITLPLEHTVVKGEHLWSIAQRYYSSGFNWVDIASENKLGKDTQLAIGQKLMIPNVEAKAVTIAGGAKDAAAVQTGSAMEPTVVAQVEPETGIAVQSISGNSYTIVKGDHLWGIAIRAYGDGYKWVDIAKANKLKHPDLIYPDQQLQLPR